MSDANPHPLPRGVGDVLEPLGPSFYVPTIPCMTYQEWQLDRYRDIRPANETDLRAAWDAATAAASKAYAASEAAAKASEKASNASEVALKASAKATMLTADVAEMDNVKALGT